MTIWFVAAAVVLIVELFIGTVYLLVVSVALAAAGIMYGLSSHFSTAVLTAAIISALGTVSYTHLTLPTIYSV